MRGTKRHIRRHTHGSEGVICAVAVVTVVQYPAQVTAVFPAALKVVTATVPESPVKLREVSVRVSVVAARPIELTTIAQLVAVRVVRALLRPIPPAEVSVAPFRLRVSEPGPYTT